MNKLKVIILAGGKGTRMMSKKPKVLHKIFDKTMVDYVIETAEKCGSSETCVIVGHQGDMVKNIIRGRVEFRTQQKQLGTGHAVMQAIDFIDDNENVLILYGDTPLITPKTINKLIELHTKESNLATVISVIEEKPQGYGRIVREYNCFKKIVEQKDANEQENLIKEINTGVYIFNSNALKSALKNLSNNNSQNEYYLTDTLEIIKEVGGKVGIMLARDSKEFLGVNSKLQLSQVTKILKDRINEYHMLNGVTIQDPDSTYIGSDVKIGEDTVILPGTIIDGKTKIGCDCVIGPYTRITNSNINDNVCIEQSTILDSQINESSLIGPYAYIRPNSKIGKNVKIGDFVEVKNSNIDDNTKISHLTYIGDSDVGKNINFGCGTVTVNYDGKNKYRTTVYDNSFIGCNTNLIAPITIGEGSYIAAGSTITDDVEKDSFAIARSRQVNKQDWSKKFK